MRWLILIGFAGIAACESNCKQVERRCATVRVQGLNMDQGITCGAAAMAAALRGKLSEAVCADIVATLNRAE